MQRVSGYGVGEIAAQCDTLYVASTSNGTWSMQPAASGSPIGDATTPDLVAPQWWTNQGFGEAVYSTNGTASQFSGTPATSVLDDGTVAVRQSGKLALVNLNDASTTISIAGTPITASAVALQGSTTVIYAAQGAVYSRDVTSGADTTLATAGPDIVSVSADANGDIYAVTASGVSQVTSGALAQKLNIGGTAINQTIDTRTGAFIVSTNGTFTSYDLSSGQVSGLITCDIPVNLTYLAPGPLANTVIGIAEALNNALVLADLTTQTCYVLDHAD